VLRGFRLLGLRFLITDHPPPGWDPTSPANPWELAIEDRHDAAGSRIDLFRLKSTLPRAWVVHRARVLSARDPALDAVLAPTFNPRLEVVLAENAPSGIAGSETPLDPSPEAAAAAAALFREEEVRVTAPTSDSLVAEFEAKRSGLMVFSEIYFPGWRATVDGVPTPVLRANHAFRAVAVPTGARRVVMTFEDPPGLRTGVWLSALGIALALGIVMCDRKRNR